MNPHCFAPLSRKSLNIAVTGTYVPRQCGIATFTDDLCRAMDHSLGANGAVFAIAMDDSVNGYEYPQIVRLQIRDQSLPDYRLAAEHINNTEPDAVILQHEYGIFGGTAGKYILSFLERLRCPIITTAHTILDQPESVYRAVMQKIVELSDRIVVMSRRGMEMMSQAFPDSAAKVTFIPHGIPDMPFEETDAHKARFNLQDRRVILTFGLLSPNKGIEVMLRALPEVVGRYPNVTYVVLGATHPNVKRKSGEEYRNELKQLARRLGLEPNVLFLNRFAQLDELCQWLRASDLYVTPYLSKEQITSGTLAYAVGAGKAVISTPYWHAEELLSDGRGVLVPFGDSGALADAILELFDDDEKRNAMRRKAYAQGRQMIWPQVARQYIELVRDTMEQRYRRPRVVASPSREYVANFSELPEVDLRQMLNLTDDTGILQHARFATPDRDHGYCTDDNARALIAAAMYWSLSEDSSIVAKLHTYLSFLEYAFDPQSGRFRNFMSYDRRWLEQVGSEDSHGRAIWALGVLINESPTRTIRTLGERLFDQALPAVLDFTWPRAVAFALVGIDRYLRKFGVDSRVRRIRSQLAHWLLSRFLENRRPDWPWFEDSVTYCNARLADALLLSGQAMSNQQMLDVGLECLEWLLKVQTAENGRLSVIGCQGWMHADGRRARFDQQPVEAMSLVQACVDAYNISGSEMWLRRARWCFNWFLGNNDLNLPLYDFSTGGCRDGLEPSSVNENQGAESTLSWLISLCTMHKVDSEIAARDTQVDGRLARRDTMREMSL